MYFCVKCKNFSPTDCCQFCGKKKLRQAEANDPVFLTTIKNSIYAGMLDNMLKQNNIPFIRQEKFGGLLKFTGLGLPIEEFNFYVPLGEIEKSKEILAGLFDSTSLRLAKNSARFKKGARRIKPK